MDIVSVTRFDPSCWTKLYGAIVVNLEFLVCPALLLEAAGAANAGEYAEFAHQTGTDARARLFCRPAADEDGRGSSRSRAR